METQFLPLFELNTWNRALPLFTKKLKINFKKYLFQDDLGTMECSLAEILRAPGNKVRNRGHLTKKHKLHFCQMGGGETRRSFNYWWVARKEGGWGEGHENVSKAVASFPEKDVQV